MNENENTLFGQRDDDAVVGEISLRKDQSDDRGLVCPKCGCRRFDVYYVRKTKQGTIIRRRRCMHCGRSILTHERVVSNA